MTCPCSFDWKLFVDFLKALLSFPVVLLTLSLIIFNRYGEEIRKKIVGMTKASAAGAEILFSVEQMIAIADENSAINANHQVESGAPPDTFQDFLRLLGYINPSFKALIEETKRQLAQDLRMERM